MYSRRALLLLWLVRELQPISADEIRKKEGALPSPADFILIGTNMGVALRVDLPNLMKAGLIATENGEPFTTASPLITTQNLSIVQDLFGISLSERIKHSTPGITAYPIFDHDSGKPAHKALARIFVAMPFKDELTSVYTDHILKVAKKLKISCERGDEHLTTSAIMNDIWAAIYYAEICIVDCTGQNPNVFYELGIAHTLGRKTILITQNSDDIPFDIRHIRHIEYEYTPPGMADFEKKLARTLRKELTV